MKALERNISRHSNGNLYFVARRSGRLVVRSLGTKSLVQARRTVAEEGVRGLSLGREPAAPAERGGLVNPLLDLEGALKEHDRGLVLVSHGSREMADRAKRAVLRFAGGWEGFSPVQVWKDYRASGLERGPKRELTSAANHLTWYLRKFVPWAVSRGYLAPEMLEELEKLKKLPTNSRRIRVPSPAQVDELLRMVGTEDEDGAEFLRFLACSGLRLRGATGLAWRDVDFAGKTIVVRQKGGKEKVIPAAPEALEILQGRKDKGFGRPFGLDQNALERLERRLKRFAKGLDLDLEYFHAFRHYFASRALMAGLTVQEVATLLGHSDGGVLVLKTYGHICGEHLRQAVSNLRLASAA